MSIKLTKILRDETGISLSECKKIAELSGGDYDAAIRMLRERGNSLAEKKSSRATLEGIVGYINNGKAVIVVELNCETDFVSRGQKFHDLLQDILSAASENAVKDVDSLLEVAINGETVREKIHSNIASIGENIKIGKFITVEYASDETASIYVHNASQLKASFGGIVSIVILKANVNNEQVNDLGRKIGMHIVASIPTYLNISDISQEKIDEEKELLMIQMKDSDKPAQIVEKIVLGRLSKFYEETVLNEQISVFDSSKSIKVWLNDSAKLINCSIEIVKFSRVKLGL